jgi:D-alanyl-D-alanine dipeptidase
MVQAGFVNYPFEWWHYSLGDQVWAQLTGTPSATFGPTEPTA